MARIVLVFLAAMLLAAPLGCAAEHAPADAGSRETGVIAPALRAVMVPGDATPAAFRRAAEAAGLHAGAEGVPVDVQTRGLVDADRPRFELDGVTVRHFSARYERVAAVVRDPAALRALARLPVVRYIAPAYGPAEGAGD